MEKRSNFSNRLGFVLAAAGSAVGLGNIWRFPYLAAKFGGGMFLIIYVLLVLTFGFTIMISEIAIGRKTGQSAVNAYKTLDKRFSFIGIITSVVPVIILPYYCVIGGWVIKYVVTYLSGGHSNAVSDNFFTDFISKPVEPIIWLLLFIAATFLIIIIGVKNGIEKANKIMMPALLFLIIFITVYSLTLPGAMEGVKYYLKPNLKDFSVKTILAALGQMFYSTSLAMGIMITYGSYMKKENDIEKSVKQIEIFDTVVAFLAGLMIVPAVFVFSGGNQEALQQGPSLMFVTMPKIFESMSLGSIIGTVFFILVLFAALTSSISLMETVVSIVQDKFKTKRLTSCIIVLVYCIIFALPSSLGFGIWSGFNPLPGMTILDFFDYISNSILMPIVAFLSCIFVAFIIGRKTISDEVKISSKFKREKLFNVMIKYIAPWLLIAILVSSLFIKL